MSPKNKIELIIEILLEEVSYATDDSYIRIRGKKFKDHHIQYYDVEKILHLLQYEGILTFLNTEDLHSPLPSSITMGPEITLIPNIALLREYAQKLNRNIDISEAKMAPPELWEIQEKESSAVLIHNKKKIYTFETIKSNKYKYFKCLWQNYGQFVRYPKLFEFESQKKYPGEKKAYKTNADIRATINTLRKDLETTTVKGIQIVTDRGCKLILSII